MKAKVFMMMAALFCCVVAMAKDIKTVVFNTTPEMHCANCENKIKSNIRFEKGVKDIVTDLKTKTVTVKYDADKTTVDKLVAGFAKINYKATVAGCDKQGKKESCCKKKGESCCKKDNGEGCCKKDAKNK